MITGLATSLGMDLVSCSHNLIGDLREVPSDSGG